MKLTILEVGQQITDVQSFEKEHEGTLVDYMYQTNKEISENPDLELKQSVVADDGSVVIEYVAKKMANKTITHYAFIPLP